jgi:hypothetical protein
MRGSREGTQLLVPPGASRLTLPPGATFSVIKGYGLPWSTSGDSIARAHTALMHVTPAAHTAIEEDFAGECAHPTRSGGRAASCALSCPAVHVCSAVHVRWYGARPIHVWLILLCNGCSEQRDFDTSRDVYVVVDGNSSSWLRRKMYGMVISASCYASCIPPLEGARNFATELGRAKSRPETSHSDRRAYTCTVLRWRRSGSGSRVPIRAIP